MAHIHHLDPHPAHRSGLNDVKTMLEKEIFVHCSLAPPSKRDNENSGFQVEIGMLLCFFFLFPYKLLLLQPTLVH